jgi:TRAP-type mannitol/chloroaromatic compound transport system permease small subunit
MQVWGGDTLKIGFLLNLIDTIGNWIGKITSFLMTAIIGYMIASVVVRYFLHGSIPYLSIVPNIFYVYVCLGAAYAYNQKSFIIVDIIYNRFSIRKRAAIDLLTSVFFFLFVGALLQVSGGYALTALDKFKFDPAILIEPARWPITIIFPLGPFLLLVAGSVRLIRNIIIVVGASEEVSSEKATVPAREGVQVK